MLALLWFAPAVAEEEGVFERVQALVRAGTPELALHVLERHRPSADGGESWQRWERLWVAVQRRRGDVGAIETHLERLPAEAPAALRQELWAAAADAALEAGEAAAARRFLRRLLWRERGTGAARRRWRRKVIESYLRQGHVQDARIAAGRFQREFTPSDPRWIYLYARVLIRAGDAAAAVRRTAGRQTHEGRLLHLLARLRSGQYTPQRVIEKAEALARETRKRAAMHRRAWALAAEAAAAAGDLDLEVRALERALPAGDPLFKVDADTLWRAYERYAEALGNAAHLLIGDDAAWLAEAERHRKKAAHKARAIYALVAWKGRDPGQREWAHARLLELLRAADLGRVATQLYLHAARYPDPAALPAPVRYVLAERALKARDFHLAQRLAEGLERPPPGVSRPQWLLRRARLAVYAGKPVQGVALIDAALDGRDALDEAQAEEVLDVLFDLQAIGRHREALGLFERVYALARSARIKRQILFWMGDSRRAQKADREAAELYLRSAFFERADPNDVWGQAARYHAARALARAGLSADAEAVYQALLDITSDPRRRAVIERELQQMGLLGPPGALP